MKGRLKRYHAGYLRTLIEGDLFKFEVIHCGMKKATGNKIAEYRGEPELFSEGERYEDVFLLLIYPAWSSVKRWVPHEKTAAEEGRELENQDAANL